MEKKKNYLTVYETFNKEEIQRYTENMGEKELASFVIGFENYIKDTEGFYSRKIEGLKIKNNNIDLILKRIWIHLKEKDRNKLAEFFKSISDIHK